MLHLNRKSEPPSICAQLKFDVVIAATGDDKVNVVLSRAPKKKSYHEEVNARCLPLK